MHNDSQKYIKLKKRALFWAPICKYSLFVTIQPKNASQKPKRWYLRIQTFFLRFSSHSRWCNIAARGLLSFASEHKICNTFALKRLVYLRNLVSIPHESSAHYGRFIQLNRRLVKLDMFQAFTTPRRKKTWVKNRLCLFLKRFMSLVEDLSGYDECVEVRSCSQPNTHTRKK